MGFEVRLRLLGHRLRIVSIDLDRQGSRIEGGLTFVLGPATDAPSAPQTE